VKVYSGSAFGLVGQVVCCECIYWDCVWFRVTRMAH